ncbi:MAG: PD40 domain-containing protein, partial [Planctomycetes bacterium]|nr:PD40 domain-containing protein [Planctomycetota bacterium]
LPESVAVDAERLARFEREARTLAALNHPHIAQIYGLEDGGARGKALVMELVPGQTLAERIADGPVPVPETLEIARQIADALECAHAEGIVHRDLKPANIKVREDGAVKVLDFGLAKGGDSGAMPNLQDSPTFTSPAMTERGIILGTAAYMSPEQARGKPVDKRADIWAFGVIGFEMLTGKQMFAGETVSDTLAAVLREDVPWSALPAGTPPALRRVLERCLQKDPRRRLRDIGDARLEIEDAIAGKDASTVEPAAHIVGDKPSGKLPWLVAAAAVAAAIALAGWSLTRQGSARDDVIQFTQITDTAGEETDPSLSPDGTVVAFASRASGSWDIYSQRVGGRNRTLIVGDPQRDEMAPAFSPDGSQIAFHESDGDGGIFVAGATGESTRRVTDVGFHPSWSPDGKQIAYTTEEIKDPYSRQGLSQLWTVSVSGGGSRKVTEIDAAQPSWSPSGERLVFWSNMAGQRDLFTVSAAGGEATPIFEDAHVDFAPTWLREGGRIVFSSDRGGSINLWEVPVDPATGRATGGPVPVTAGVQAAAEFASVSRDGSKYAFKSRVKSINPYAIAFDPLSLRAGTPVQLDSANSILVPSSVSPDGKYLLLSNQGTHQEDLFITGTDRFVPRRVTDDAARDRGGSWTSDGKSILFYSTRGGKWEIWSINADGGGLRKVASLSDSAIYPLMSPAADRIALTSANTTDVNLIPVTAEVVTKATALTGTSLADARLMATAWSPDGRLLAGPLIPSSGRPAGIGIYDITSGSLKKISNDACVWVAWLPGTQKVGCMSSLEQLVFVDVQSMQRTVAIEKLAVPAEEGVFAIARDGRTVYYGGARLESDIWIAERRKQ